MFLERWLCQYPFFKLLSINKISQQLRKTIGILTFTAFECPRIVTVRAHFDYEGVGLRVVQQWLVPDRETKDPEVTQSKKSQWSWPESEMTSITNCTTLGILFCILGWYDELFLGENCHSQRQQWPCWVQPEQRQKQPCFQAQQSQPS